MTFEIRPDGLRATFSKGSDAVVVVDADYGVSKDGVLFARVCHVEREDRKVGPSAFDPRFKPCEGDLFSFRFKEHEGTLTLSDLKGCGSGKPLVEGEYRNGAAVARAGGRPAR